MEQETAPVVKRVINVIIDFIIIGVIVQILVMFGLGYTLTQLAYIVTIFGYYTIMEAKFGKTVGKFVTKTKVVMEDGSEPTQKDYALRSVCRLIPLEGLFVLFNNGKALHDSLTKTRVVSE